MIEFSAEVEIPAPPRRVWDALMDFPSYPEWNPYIAVRGVPALGSEIQWSYPARLIKRAWTSAIITEFDEPNAITWSFRVGWLFGFEERFRLYPSREGTRLKHSVRCRGMIAQLGRRPLRKTLAVVICAANDGLRRYVDVPVSVSPMPAAIRRAKAKKKTPVPVSATGSPHQGSS